MNTDIENLFKDKVLGHPAGLFVLFFTEMWERFSFYGMRVLLVQFLTMALIGYNPGWEWSVENAGALFGTYAMLLYITPIIGGIIADKITGYRFAVIIGSLIMTLGHASMALETEASLYIGLGLLVIGTGFFKPTMTSIISEMYKKSPEKKDGAYTIFYMGVNAGAFFGMMLCGYLAEKVGWAYGFGLAGIFMLLGTLQFWLSSNLFGNIGAKPTTTTKEDIANNKEAAPNENTDTEKLNPFTTLDKILIVISSVIGLGYAINDPLSKIAGFDMFSAFATDTMEGQYVAVLFALAVFMFLVISRISRYTRIVRDRMIAFIVFAFFTVFFWLSFEQGASSLVIFARDNVDRMLSGTSAIAFNVINTLLTVIPLIIITYVLYILWKKTYSKIPYSNIILVVCFVFMWSIVGWMLNRDFNTIAYDVNYSAIETPVLDDKGIQKFDDKGNKYGLGLIIMAIGFGLLAYATKDIPLGAKTAKLSMIWLVLAYLFHTLGELCLSPMGLSYLSKLVPARMVAFMFGVYYLAIAIGNKLAHYIGGDIEKISQESGLSYFFLIFTIVPIALGLVSFALHPLLKKLMHGVR
jgi:POT family proton-dependent oligopeptide transporter